MFGSKKEEKTVKKLVELMPEDYDKIPDMYKKQIGGLRARLDVLEEKDARSKELINQQQKIIETLRFEKAVKKPIHRGRETDWKILFANLPKRPIKVINRDHRFLGWLSTIGTKQVGSSITHTIYVQDHPNPKKVRKIVPVMENMCWEDMFHKPQQLSDTINSGIIIINIDSQKRYVPDPKIEIDGDEEDLDHFIAEKEDELTEAQEEAKKSKKRFKKESHRRQMDYVKSAGDKEEIKALKAEITSLTTDKGDAHKRNVLIRSQLSTAQTKNKELSKKTIYQENVIKKLLKKMADKEPLTQREIEELSLKGQFSYITDTLKDFRTQTTPAPKTLKIVAPTPKPKLPKKEK